MIANRNLFSLSIGLTLLFLAASNLSSCKKNECEDVLCTPCPGSQFVIEYRDSLDSCISGLKNGTRIYAFRNNDMNDTIYSYDFSGECTATFLVEKGIMYHVVNQALGLMDEIHIEDFEYQGPIEITSCCLCYPVAHIHGHINGEEETVNWPDGEYASTPFVRVWN